MDFGKLGTIKGLSERRRLPLLGKIRLGLKVKSAKGVEYPKETDYFVVPEEVKKVYGDKPTQLDIMIPVARREVVFHTAYRMYGKQKGIKCIGNGELAYRKSDDGDMIEIPCPCEKLNGIDGKKGECSQRAFLMVILPKINMGGVYQVTTSSINSIIDINSGLDYVEALIGRCQMIPLVLKREKIETHYNHQKQTHYTLKIIFDGNIEFINQLRENNKRILLSAETIALPAPIDENPENDAVDIIEESQEEENNTNQISSVMNNDDIDYKEKINELYLNFKEKSDIKNTIKSIAQQYTSKSFKDLDKETDKEILKKLYYDLVLIYNDK